MVKGKVEVRFHLEAGTTLVGAKVANKHSSSTSCGQLVTAAKLFIV